jgi:hypothetical protein
MKNLIIISLFLFAFLINESSGQTRIFRGGSMGLDFELMINFTKTNEKEYSIAGHYFYHKTRTPYAVTGNLKNGVLRIERKHNKRVREIFTARKNNNGRWVGTVKLMNKNLIEKFFVDELRGKASRGKHGSSHWAWNLETNEIIYPENISGYADEELTIQTLLSNTAIYDKLSEKRQYENKPVKVNGKLFSGTISGYGNYGESLIYEAKFMNGNLVGEAINFNKKWEEENGGTTEEDVSLED